MPKVRSIAPCLWFDDQAEEAARYYCGIFESSKITKITHYGTEAQEMGRAPGSVLTVAFELDGHPFIALNGGPEFKFNEAVSLMIQCDTQADVDYFWDKLTAGGPVEAQVCGWLKDRYGVSWQVVPAAFLEMVGQPEDPRSQRAMKAMMKMKKLDLAALQKAYDGG
jgi:predicted 3-demethylubiquinone-9 3-methyltransferase (glyoxalase superfamily)